MSKKNDTPEVAEIGCLEALDGLYAYIDGEMDDPMARAKIEHHLGHCSACYSRIELVNLLTQRIQKSAKGHAPESLRNRLQDVLGKL